jgi:hypothetical protein
LQIISRGRGSYQRTRVTEHGFPRGYLTRQKAIEGFQTGDLVRAEVPKGKYAGVHTGRVMIRATGSFDIKTKDGSKTVNYKYCKLLERGDGYEYQIKQEPKFLP